MNGEAAAVSRLRLTWSQASWFKRCPTLSASQPGPAARRWPPPRRCRGGGGRSARSVNSC